MRTGSRPPANRKSWLSQLTVAAMFDFMLEINRDFAGPQAHTYSRMFQQILAAPDARFLVHCAAGLGRTEQEVCDELNREYAYQKVVVACEAQGYRLEEQNVGEDGTIKLSVSKWG